MSELMRRATPGLALAGAALATVWLFDPALHPQVTPTAASSPMGSGTADGSGEADAGSTDSGSTDSGSADSGSADSGSASGSGPATSDCNDATSVTGEPAMTQWGPVQVRMDFAADGSVCGVQAVTYPDGDRRSAQINSMAIPYLDAQAAAVGVEFDAFSGATYTSEAYRQSMQSILDQR